MNREMFGNVDDGVIFAIISRRSTVDEFQTNPAGGVRRERVADDKDAAPEMSKLAQLLFGWATYGDLYAAQREFSFMQMQIFAQGKFDYLFNYDRELRKTPLAIRNRCVHHGRRGHQSYRHPWTRQIW